MGNGIYFKIARKVDLDVLIIFNPRQIFDIINGFWVITQNLQCSIFSNSGHVGWCTALLDTILKLDTLVMIQTKFGFHWSSTFRGEDFWKSLRRTTDDNDRRQVMAIAQLTLWLRWAKKLTTDGRPVVASELIKQIWPFEEISMFSPLPLYTSLIVLYI